MRRFTKEDIDMIEIWHKKHGVEIPSRSSYPETGFIEENVAAGFLYRTDADFCLIEGIVYNPDAPKELRDKALDECIENIILEAMALGYKSVVGFTDLEVVVERSKRFNFIKQEKKYNMVTRGLLWDS